MCRILKPLESSILPSSLLRGFTGSSAVKNPPASAGEADLIPGSGRSPGEGNGNPLQYSCLENLTDRGAWGAVAWGHKELDTIERLNNNISCGEDPICDGAHTSLVVWGCSRRWAHPQPLQWKRKVNHWTTRDVPLFSLYCTDVCKRVYIFRHVCASYQLVSLLVAMPGGQMPGLSSPLLPVGPGRSRCLGVWTKVLGAQLCVGPGV